MRVFSGCVVRFGSTPWPRRTVLGDRQPFKFSESPVGGSPCFHRLPAFDANLKMFANRAFPARAELVIGIAIQDFFRRVMSAERLRVHNWSWQRVIHGMMGTIAGPWSGIIRETATGSGLGASRRFGRPCSFYEDRVPSWVAHRCRRFNSGSMSACNSARTDCDVLAGQSASSNRSNISSDALAAKRRASVAAAVFPDSIVILAEAEKGPNDVQVGTDDLSAIRLAHRASISCSSPDTPIPPNLLEVAALAKERDLLSSSWRGCRPL